MEWGSNMRFSARTSVPLVASALQASPANSGALALLPGPTGPTSSPGTSRKAEEQARRARLARERNAQAAQARVNNDGAALRELARSLDVSDEAEWAYNDLSHGLLLAGERGEVVPCQGPGRDAWTADDPMDQELAADLCLLCPVFALCQRYADEARPAAGTWAGVTRNPAKDQVGRLRERKPGVCARGLHDVTRPGAVYESPSGRKECQECRLARQERKRKSAPKAPRRPTRNRHPQRAAGGRDCKCRCGGTTRGGWYLPGHDSQHLSALAAQVRDGDLTLDAALAEVGHSDRLPAKLAARVG